MSLRRTLSPIPGWRANRHFITKACHSVAQAIQPDTGFYHVRFGFPAGLTQSIASLVPGTQSGSSSWNTSHSLLLDGS
jgi:hypothetical protein